MTAAEIEALAAAVWRRMAEHVTPPMRPLTTMEAARHAGHGSEDAFREWASRWQVKPCGHGRWPVERLNAGLAREKRQGVRVRKPRAVKEKQEAAA